MKYLDEHGHVVKRPHPGMVGHPADEAYLYGEDDFLPLQPGINADLECLSDEACESMEESQDDWLAYLQDFYEPWE